MSIKTLANRVLSFPPIELMVAAMRRWSDKRAASKGAALALYMIFSLTPILILLIALSGWFFGEDAIRTEILSRIEELAGSRSAEMIGTIMANAHYAGDGTLAALISLALLIFSSTTAFNELKLSLDEIWDVPGDRPGGLRHTAVSRALSFVIVLSLATVLLASLFIDAAIRAAQTYWHLLFGEASFALLAQGLSSLFSFLVFVALFAVVLKTLPSAVMRWRDVLLGSLLTAVLFQLGKTAIGIYLSQGNLVSSYGAAGSLVALLLWIYFSSLIFFFGASFTREYWGRYGTGRALLQKRNAQKNGSAHTNGDSQQGHQAIVPN